MSRTTDNANSALASQFGTSRRNFLLGLAACGISQPLLAAGEFLTANSRSNHIWVSALGLTAEDYGFGWITQNKNKDNLATKKGRAVLSGFRGHGASQHPLRVQSVLMFGRRPSRQIIEVDLLSGEIVHQVECAKDRHLFGHGCFSHDGHFLFTSEADLNSGDGKVVVRDARNYQRLAEFDSHGIGPHELKMIPDSHQLVVANGGILTRPETGRKKLNLESMSSNLSYIDINSGQLVNQVKVSERKASIRHLDVANDGSVAFAIQMQREVAGHNNVVPLLGRTSAKGETLLFTEPKTLLSQMKDYAASVTINNRTRTAGVTSPKGNLAAFWHLDSGELLGYHKLNDVCGLSLTADEKYFVLSSSIGQIRFIDAQRLKENPSLRLNTPGRAWDNHMLLVQI